MGKWSRDGAQFALIQTNSCKTQTESEMIRGEVEREEEE